MYAIEKINVINRFKLIVVGLLFINVWANAQSIETRLQAVIDSIYTANPSSIGILVNVKSPKNELSGSGSVGYFGHRQTQFGH